MEKEIILEGKKLLDKIESLKKDISFLKNALDSGSGLGFKIQINYENRGSIYSDDEDFSCITASGLLGYLKQKLWHAELKLKKLK